MTRRLDLFDDIYTSSHNWLPYDGEVHYYHTIMSQEQADTYYEKLRQGIDWFHDSASVNGKQYITKRKVAWYASQPLAYGYSGMTKIAQPWTDTLLVLKQEIEAITDATYNACLLNLYHDGKEGMGWHSDKEKELRRHAPIASISLGAERRFMFKHKTTQYKIGIHLSHGSLLVMQGTTQDSWLHRVPPMMKVTQPRINLTFRTINVFG